MQPKDDQPKSKAEQALELVDKLLERLDSEDAAKEVEHRRFRSAWLNEIAAPLAFLMGVRLAA